jgi:hypothetical protein
VLRSKFRRGASTNVLALRTVCSRYLKYFRFSIDFFHDSQSLELLAARPKRISARLSSGAFLNRQLDESGFLCAHDHDGLA